MTGGVGIWVVMGFAHFLISPPKYQIMLQMCNSPVNIRWRKNFLDHSEQFNQHVTGCERIRDTPNLYSLFF